MAWRLSIGLRNKLLGAATGQGSLKQIFAHGQIRLFTGSQPATAELAETGTLACTITLDGAAMTSGAGTNGLNLANAVGGIVGKEPAETWSGTNTGNHTVGWFRWYPNAFADHLGLAVDGNKIRIDGAIGVTSGELRLTSVQLVEGVPTILVNASLTLPTL